MTIKRELLKNLGFKRFDDEVLAKNHWSHDREIWHLSKGIWHIMVGYGEYNGPPYINGDKNDVESLITTMMADAESLVEEIQAGEDW